jgi:hypothetical protein
MGSKEKDESLRNYPGGKLHFQFRAARLLASDQSQRPIDPSEFASSLPIEKVMD